MGNESQKRDIFDKIMGLPVLRIFEPFYKRNKSVLMYLFFGALTTFLSIFVFFVFRTCLHFNEHTANVISWICAVTFAFFTNRTWVFDGRTSSVREFFVQARDFYGGRIFTLLVDEIIILIFITILRFNENLIKISAQVVVLVLNYVISKVFVFKKKTLDKKKSSERQ